MQSMQALQYSQYGDTNVLQLNNSANPPTLKGNQVLVEVYASSINPIDTKVRKGALKETTPLNFPVTIGGNFAGIIKEVGKGVTTLKVGDNVYGQAIVLNGGSGSMAELVASNENYTTGKPSNTSFVEAASLPLVGASAVQALEQHINLQSGQKILINGGSGGIGSIAIQLAKSKGAYVATTVSTENIEYAKSLGADEVIDYKTQDFSTILKDYDAVFDTAGSTVEKSFLVLKKGGILVSMAVEPSQELAQKYSVTALNQGTSTKTPNLIRVRELVEQGVIKPQVEKVFPFNEAIEAFTFAEHNHPRGKVVVQIKGGEEK